MKIITRLQVLSQLFTRRPKYGFSTLFQDSSLSFEDLVVQLPQNAQSKSSGNLPNISPAQSHKNSSSSLGQKDLDSKAKDISSLNFISKTLLKPVFKQSVTCFRNSNIDPQVKIQSAVYFMKLLDHSIEKISALTIIKTIEASYGTTNNQSHRQFLSLGLGFDIKNSPEKVKDSGEELFKNLRKQLTHSLNQFSENIENNGELINSVLQILADSDPSYINVENFQRNCFSMEDEEKRQEITGRKYFQINCDQKYETNSEKFSAEDKGKSKYKLALEEAFQLRDRAKFSKLYLKKQINTEDDKNFEQKLTVATDQVLFVKRHQDKTNLQKKEDDLKTAYLYELPFNITDIQANYLVQYLQSSKKIKVESFILFPYKHFIEKNYHEIIYRVPENYRENAPIEKISTTVQIDELTRSTCAKTKRNAKKQKSKFDDVPLENQPSRMKSVTDALLFKIKKENYSKFNKSSMLIKFASKADKQAILNPQSRLYGLNCKGFRNIKFEQGFCKTSISLSNIPWGCQSRELEHYLNKLLDPLKISIKIKENMILTHRSIAIQFDYLSEAILAIQTLNNTTFENKLLKAYLIYGPCKVFKNQYMINSYDSYDKLKKKIELSSGSYERKYQIEEARICQ